MTLKQALKIRILPGRKGNRGMLGRRNSTSHCQEKRKGSGGKGSWPSRDACSGKEMGQGRPANSPVCSTHHWAQLGAPGVV